MGVVTDVTVKGLTTAVTNISATGMSDTTGQAIVTSINNLRSATSPIITDDTGQDIKTAINALANAISPAASNVTFNNTGTGLSASNVQSAIAEVCSDLFQTKTYSASYTAGGNASVTLTANDFSATTPSGYTPIAVVDFSSQNVSVTVRGIYAKATGTNTMMTLRNVSSSITTSNAYITILYAKSLFL